MKELMLLLLVWIGNNSTLEVERVFLPEVKFISSAELHEKFGIEETSLKEAVVADEITAINWLKLRFGGEIKECTLDVAELRQNAMELPPPPVVKDISVHN